MDDDNSRNLDMYEFTKAMKDYMLGFSDGEIKQLFQFFDVDNSGGVDYDEFLRALTGPMPPQRKKVVMQAFAKLDRDGNGYVDINDIKGVYNASKHPDVIQGKKTEDQILMEFLETFETHHSCRNNGAPDHIVTKEEFIEYYNNISSSCPNDEYFQLMMNNSWKLNEGDKSYGKGWSADNTSAAKGGARPNTSGRIFGASAAPAKKAAPAATENMNYSEKQLVEAFRKALAKRGGRGIFGLGKQFKIADDDRSKSLNSEEFKKCVHDFRVGISPQDAARLYKVFDRDGSGSIDYDEFLRGVRGEMNQFRVQLCAKAFKIMDKDGSGVLNNDDIRQTYNAKKHPDVISGKKTEEEILGEFLDTFEQHYASNHPDSRDGQINIDEWNEYYNNVSMSVDRDDYFELMMNNTWNLDGSKVTKKGWGGEF
jgi:Ca2+-binding EF-hand superfamily protein